MNEVCRRAGTLPVDGWLRRRVDRTDRAGEGADPDGPWDGCPSVAPRPRRGPSTVDRLPSRGRLTSEGQSRRVPRGKCDVPGGSGVGPTDASQRDQTESFGGLFPL